MRIAIDYQSPPPSDEVPPVWLPVLCGELALGDAEVVDDGDDDLVVSVIAAPLPAWLPAVRHCSVPR